MTKPMPLPMPQKNKIVKLYTTKLSRSFGSKMFSSSFHNLMRFYRYNGTIWVSYKSRYYNSSIGEVVNSWNIVVNSRNAIGQNLGISLSISLSIVGVRISSISSIPKGAISKMMSIGQILGVSLSISLSIVGGVRISSISSISKVAISKMMSISPM